VLRGLDYRRSAGVPYDERVVETMDLVWWCLWGFKSISHGHQLIKEIGVRQFLFGRLLQTGGDYLPDLIEPKP